MIYFILVISIFLNALLVWYGYRVIRKYVGYSESIYFLLDDVSGFASHLESLYELQTFYGDETLQNLLLHSKKLKEDIEEFRINCALDLEEESVEGIIEDGTTKEAPRA
jgi:hypothetical protein